MPLTIIFLFAGCIPGLYTYYPRAKPELHPIL